MVIPKTTKGRLSQSGMLMTELVIAIGILLTAVLPLAYAFAREQQLLRINYQRAIAMQIVDGELEILAAGRWRDYSNGVHAIQTQAFARTNLPPGQLLLTLSNQLLRVEWLPAAKSHGSPVIREVLLP